MIGDAKAPVRGRAFAETLGLAVLAALLYAATFQRALHGTDWRWLVLWLDESGVVHPQHPGYLAAGHALRWLLAPLQLDAYDALAVLSVLGGGVAIAGCHRVALLLGEGRRFARAVALMAMVTPALWHHATVVEVHAAFAAVMAWSLWAAVRWHAAGRLRWAVLTGALTGLATLMHATGQLLLFGIALGIAWRHLDRGLPRLVGALLAFAIAHGLVWGGLFVAMRSWGHLPGAVLGTGALPDLASPSNPLDYLLQSLRQVDLVEQLGPTLWREWLQPFAPVSVLLVLPLTLPRCRAAAAVLVGVLAFYLLATVTMIQGYTDERGGYLLPLLLPAIAITLTSLPARLWWSALAATLLCGVLFRGEPGRVPPDHEFGAAAVAMAREAPTVFFVADFPEMDGAFRADPRLDLLLARKEYDELQAAQLRAGPFEPTPEQVAGWLTLLTVQAKEKSARLVITDRAVEWLSARVPGFDAGLRRFVERLGADRLPPPAGIAGYVVE